MEQTINIKGMEINIDATIGMGESYIVDAKGEYKHSLELEMEFSEDQPNLIFTWGCTNPQGEWVALVNNGIYGVNSINDLKAKVIQPSVLGEDIFVNDEVALKELIIIMEQVYSFDA